MSRSDPSAVAESSAVRRAVRGRYEQIALGTSGGCGPECCADSDTQLIQIASEGAGYSPHDLREVPGGGELSLGCGNPTGTGVLAPGDSVLDLGSGGGLDCFLAARQVGPSGRVVGVDMTQAMLDRARDAARRGGVANVEFRLGEIEHLPSADRAFDVVLSNCVVNLSADKRAVFAEAFRVLRPGGRLEVSDIVATRPIPEERRQDLRAWTSCSAGAISAEEIRGFLTDVGFESIDVAPRGGCSCSSDDLGVVSMSIRARRPTD